MPSLRGSSAIAALVIEALAAMGPVAEGAAADALKNVGNDRGMLNELYKLLGKIGTSASLPTLRTASSGRDGGEALKAWKAVEDRVNPAGPLTANFVDDLKSADRGERAHAVETLANLQPSGTNRGPIARALDAVWESDDVFIKRSLREAVVRWGDDQSANFLADQLAKPDLKSWEEAMQALVALKPDARTGQILVDHLPKNVGLVLEMAKKFPTLVEGPLVGLVQQDGEARWRIEACKALGNLGSPAVIPTLQALGQICRIRRTGSQRRRRCESHQRPALRLARRSISPYRRIALALPFWSIAAGQVSPYEKIGMR